MSKKPPKKSDLSKGWMKARRDKPKKIAPEYHLIVTEGTDTEPAYFGAIRDSINDQYRGRIQLDIYGEGDNTLSLLEKARRRATESPNVYKHVWLIYDTDDFPAEHIDKTAALCEKISTEETKYHAIWSNQCIELWFLLHFSYMHSDLHRTEYWPKLSQHLKGINAGEYYKNRNDMYAVLYPYMDVAISNAKRLEEENYGKLPSKSAPGTRVYVLVEKLRPYLNVA